MFEVICIEETWTFRRVQIFPEMFLWVWRRDLDLRHTPSACICGFSHKNLIWDPQLTDSPNNSAATTVLGHLAFLLACLWLCSFDPSDAPHGRMPLLPPDVALGEFGSTNDCVHGGSVLSVWHSALDHFLLYISLKKFVSPQSTNFLQSSSKVLQSHPSLIDHCTETRLWFFSFTGCQ